MGGELAGFQQLADVLALRVRRPELRRMAEALVQFLLDRLGAVLPVRRGRAHPVGVRLLERLEACLAKQQVQVPGYREAVALGRVVQRQPGGDEDQQPDPPAWAGDAAQLPQHAQLSVAAGERAQDAQGPGRVSATVRQGQGNGVRLDDGRPEERGGGAARRWLELEQQRPDARSGGCVGGGAAEASPDVGQQRPGCRIQAVQQPVQRSGLAAAAAGSRDGIPWAEPGGDLGGPFGHGAEFGGHRAAAVTPARDASP
jgi:hypothetical protein